MQRNNLSVVLVELEDALARLDVPQACRVVGRAGREQVALGVERHAHDLFLVSHERVQTLAGNTVPNLDGGADET